MTYVIRLMDKEIYMCVLGQYDFFDHNFQIFCDLLLRDSYENQIPAFEFYSSKVGLHQGNISVQK